MFFLIEWLYIDVYVFGRYNIVCPFLSAFFLFLVFPTCMVQVQFTSSSTSLFDLPSFSRAFLIGHGAVSMNLWNEKENKKMSVVDLINLSMRLVSSLEKAPTFGANWSLPISSSSPCIGRGMDTGLPRCLLATTGTNRPARLEGT